MKNPQRQLEDAEFISFVRALDECWMQGRPQDLESFLAEDVVLVAPGGKPRILGITQAIESYRQFTEYAEVSRFETYDYVVTKRGDTAIVEYEWKMTWTSSGAEHNDVGREVLVIVQREKKWQVVWRTQIPKNDPLD